MTTTFKTNIAKLRYAVYKEINYHSQENRNH